MSERWRDAIRGDREDGQRTVRVERERKQKRGDKRETAGSKWTKNEE